MSSVACVCAAGLIHFTHNWALPPDRSKVAGPQFPSFVVAIALLDLIYDNRRVPPGIEELPVVYQRIYELVVALLLLELGIYFIWRPVERVIHLLTKIFLLGTGLFSEGLFLRTEHFWVGCVTVPLSLLILIFVTNATDHFHFLYNRGSRVETKVRLNVDATLRLLRREQRATGMPLPQYAETLQRYKDAETRRRRGLVFQRHFQNEYDSPSD